MPDDFLAFVSKHLEEGRIDIDEPSILQMAERDRVDAGLEGGAVTLLAEPQLFGDLSQPLLGLLALGDVLAKDGDAGRLPIGHNRADGNLERSAIDDGVL